MQLEYTKDRSKLLQKTNPWNFENPEMDIIELSESMVSFMLNEMGLGLAYNQLELPGSYSVFAMRGEPENFIFINPRIVWKSEEIVELDEGCLSYPQLTFKIKRPRHVKIRFQAPDGKTYTKTFANLTARVIQHEMDHLEGRPFWHSISKLKFDMGVKKVYNKGYDYRNLPYKGF